MKATKLILSGLIILCLFGFAGPTQAQEKSKEEKEKELRMAEEIDAQKKAFAEQKKKKEEMDKVAKEAREEVEKAMEEAREKLEEAGIYNDMSKDFRNWSDNPAFKWQQFEGGRYMMTPGMDPFTWQHAGSDSERTDWEYSRSVKGNSFSGTYAMDVRLPSTVVMSVNGECKEGEIKIRIIMPDGKVYSDIMIDEFGNLNWRKSFSVSAEENKEKAGEWKFQIDASKATGLFRISFRAY
ncbi:MAG TPA: hypothetical protein DCY25_10100 [Bacteroidales bacterium]|nr:hypothetical protein [Bacteroidales bacterium]